MVHELCTACTTTHNHIDNHELCSRYVYSMYNHSRAVFSMDNHSGLYSSCTTTHELCSTWTTTHELSSPSTELCSAMYSHSHGIYNHSRAVFGMYNHSRAVDTHELCSACTTTLDDCVRDVDNRLTSCVQHVQPLTVFVMYNLQAVFRM